MPSAQAQSIQCRLDFPQQKVNWEGILTDLLTKLSRRLEFDNVTLTCGSRSTRSVTLRIRSGPKSVLLVKMSSRAGRCRIEIAGTPHAGSAQAASICRDHFEDWFGEDSRRIERTPRLRAART